jgi:hypothetical protein
MTTAAQLLWEWWEKALTVSRTAGYVPAEAVQSLIESSRKILAAQRCTKWDSDSVLFDIYIAIHWDWNQPTDRVFETMLEFELADYFSHRGFPA